MPTDHHQTQYGHNEDSFWSLLGCDCQADRALLNFLLSGDDSSWLLLTAATSSSSTLVCSSARSRHSVTAVKWSTAFSLSVFTKLFIDGSSNVVKTTESVRGRLSILARISVFSDFRSALCLHVAQDFWSHFYVTVCFTLYSLILIHNRHLTGYTSQRTTYFNVNCQFN